MPVGFEGDDDSVEVLGVKATPVSSTTGVVVSARGGPPFFSAQESNQNHMFSFYHMCRVGCIRVG
jgi:hypothetical protein